MVLFSIADVSEGTRTNTSRIQTLYAYLAVQREGDPKKITKLRNYLNGPHKSAFCFQTAPSGRGVTAQDQERIQAAISKFARTETMRPFGVWTCQQDTAIPLNLCL